MIASTVDFAHAADLFEPSNTFKSFIEFSKTK